MVGLRVTPPPAAAAVEQWVLADYTELRRMRAGLRRAVADQVPDGDDDLDDLIERMTIVATELATNALSHARSEAVVRLSRSRTALVLDVADDLPSVAPELAAPRPTGAGGRGLQVTQQLAADLGWYRDGGRKHVWARFRLPRRRGFPAPWVSVARFICRARGTSL